MNDDCVVIIQTLKVIKNIANVIQYHNIPTVFITPEFLS